MDGLIRRIAPQTVKGVRWRAYAVAAVAAAIGFCSANARAEMLPQPTTSNFGFAQTIGFFSVLLSVDELPGNADQGQSVKYTLADGTKVGGLLYIDSSKGPRPLIIADFGLMSSTDSILAGDLIQKVVAPGLLNANFLVLDDVSGADFYVSNRSLSLGGYDAGRVFLQLADQLAAQNVPFTRLHLLGESLGGLAVIEALVEDERLGNRHFQSAITFSGVTDELQATGSVMSAFGHDLSGISGPWLSTEGRVFLSGAVAAFDGFVSTSPSGGGLAEPTFFDAGNLFYQQFTQRLQAINANLPADWNTAVNLSSVESYLETSAPLVDGIAAVPASLTLVHAQNDPVVAYSEFASFAQAQQGNPRVLTLGTPYGSHCGFLGAYGASWVANLINEMLAR